MIFLASVKSIPYGVLSSYTSIATKWLKHVLAYVIQSHHFNTSHKQGIHAVTNKYNDLYYSGRCTCSCWLAGWLAGEGEVLRRQPAQMDSNSCDM